MIHKNSAGFTLIELLVVVTIIVILIALLVPAMDKAIYQAELAVCGANLRGVGTGVTTYAMDFKRRYPHRAGAVDEATAAFQADSMNYPFSNGNKSLNDYDDRTAIRDHVNLKGLVCPLSGKINLSAPTSSTWVFSNYAMWWSWRYRHTSGGVGGVGATTAPEPGMMKMGDRLHWTPPSGVTYRFNVLAADHSYNLPSVFGAIESTHPDVLGVLTFQSHDDEFDPVFAAAMGNPNIRYTRSTWGVTGQYGPSGTTDRNYLYDDGSVRRFNRVDHHLNVDKRFINVPNSPESNDGSLYQLLPDRS